MIDELSRITVIGGRRRIDLTVPTHAVIADYAGELARLCAVDEDGPLPPVWSLGSVPNGAHSPTATLADLGAVDGQVFYLCDAIAAETLEPTVHDLAEQVTQASAGVLDRRWDATLRKPLTLAAGLGALAASGLVLGATGRGPSAAASAAGALVVALVLLGFTRIGAVPRRAVPDWARIAAALAAIPVLAAAGHAGAVAQISVARQHGMSAGVAETLGTAAGAVLGAVLAATAAFGITTCAVLLGVTVCALAAALTTGFGADTGQTAAVFALLSYFLLALAPAVSVRIARLALRHEVTDPAAGGGDQVRRAVGKAMQLLAVWTVAISVVAAGSLVLCALSRSTAAAAAAGCLGAALLLRSGGAKLAVEVTAVAGAGAVGMTAALLGPRAATHLHGSLPTAVLLIVTVAVLWQSSKSTPAVRLRPRPGWFTAGAALCSGLGLALTVVSFGITQGLVHMGHTL